MISTIRRASAALLLGGLMIAPLGLRAAAATESVVYSFRGGVDGVAPRAGLLKLGNTLYGTTYSGGTSSLNGGLNCNFILTGCGTVFSVTLAGDERVLHSFQGLSDGDGALPMSGLIALGGRLYGTTFWGGAGGPFCKYGCGTVYSVTRTVSVDVLYAFPNAFGHEVLPASGVVGMNGKLYGTTKYGGTPYPRSSGAVYEVTLAGAETTLYSFGGDSDAATPAAGLTSLGGTLYGTTTAGGAHGYGTVFSVTPSGVETILYSFRGGSDGAGPAASLVSSDGVLYGTTSGGGIGGKGTVFRLTTAGDETVIHAFAGGHDGASPNAGLLDVDGTLYGTTSGGGAGGEGTVFAIAPAGDETVLHAFAGADGADPEAALICADGVLYGTTAAGGAYGYGTVFRLKP